MITFTVPGRPVPAVRMTQRGKWVKKDAGRYLAYKSHVAWMAKQAMSKAGLPAEPSHAPFEIEATFYIWIGWQSPDMDGSNLLKTIEDAIQGVIIHNDRQILRGSFRKVFIHDKDAQCAVVTVKEINMLGVAEG